MDRKVDIDKGLLEAMEVLEKERNISRDTLIETIENSLLTACKNHLGKADSIKVAVNPNTYDFAVHVEEAVMENAEDDCLEMSLADAKVPNPRHEVGDTIQIPLNPKKFGRIVTQNAKNVILQKICEEEHKTLYNEYYMKEKDVMTDVVQRYLGRNVSIDLGKADAIFNESEQIKGEVSRSTEQVKIYVIEVKDTSKGPRVSVPRTCPDLAKCLFESEVTEAHDGTVEIKAIVKGVGSRIKIAMKPSDANADPVGACVGPNGSRVNFIINKLEGEKIDIINWDGNPAYLIENASSPTKVICVVADEEERETQVIVPDYQLSFAIGKEGQNARLAVGFTGFKIDIKSEAQAREMGLFEQIGLQYDDMSSENYGEEQGKLESYQEYEENYQGDGGER